MKTVIGESVVRLKMHTRISTATRGRYLYLLLLVFQFGSLIAGPQIRTREEADLLGEEARASLKRGAAFFRSLAIQGGYVYFYTLDLKQKWGEGRTDEWTIEVQPPGTPAVGQSFLRAYRATGDQTFLVAAEEAADALIQGQGELGGWDHKIHFNRPPTETVSFDDDQTQSATRFLMALDQEVDRPALSKAIQRALDMMMKAQMSHGGWPHRYPKQLNYHDFATFNDGVINDCIKVMLDAYQLYGRPEYLLSLRKAAWFLLQSQLPPPQPGWAQQYNAYLQPAWARSFEPPSVCPAVTLRNIDTLIELSLQLKSDLYLEPIPDALRWVEETRLPNGRWARFVEIGTGRPLYYDRGRIRVDSPDQLSLERRTGYGYEQDLSQRLREAQEKFEELSSKGREVFLRDHAKRLAVTEIISRLSQLSKSVQEVIRTQDSLGRWVVRNDRYRKSVPGRRWNGVYEIKDRVSSALFNRNVAILCSFLELTQLLHLHPKD